MTHELLGKALSIKSDLDTLKAHHQDITEKYAARVKDAKGVTEKKPYLQIEVPGYTNGGYRMYPALLDINKVHELYVEAVENKIKELEAEFQAL